MLVLNNKKGGAIMEEVKNKKLKSVTGGAKLMKEPPKKIKCLFHCKKCGKSWKEKVANPKDYHGCKYCGWWFMEEHGNLDENGNLTFKNECVEYKPL